MNGASKKTSGRKWIWAVPVILAVLIVVLLLVLGGGDDSQPFVYAPF